jgi:hypothetical protein
MGREWYKPPVLLIWAMWLALPLSWLEYHQNWDQLPARMAVHFDVKRHPNGFTSKDGALYLGLGIMAVILLLFTVASFAIRALRPQAAWPALVIAYIVLGVVWYGNHSVVRFNLNPAVSNEPRVSQLSASSSSVLRLRQESFFTENWKLRTENS